MKLAIIGSRSIKSIQLEGIVSNEVTEIVSGGAKGVDALAKEYASEKKIPITEFLPNYNLYGKAAPLVRNKEIAAYADEALVFWDGVSKGTKYTIKLFRELGKKITVVMM